MIKAIETVYKGYRFRSRLEARWAVFLDAVNVEWEYEVEGFELPDGTRYLPDFLIKPNISHLPDGLYLEIKPTDPSDVEMSKAKHLCYGTGMRVDFGMGLPGEYPLIALRSSKIPDSVLYYMAMAIADDCEEVVSTLFRGVTHLGFWGDFWLQHKDLIEQSKLRNYWRSFKCWNSADRARIDYYQMALCPSGHFCTFPDIEVFDIPVLEDSPLRTHFMCEECQNTYPKSFDLIEDAYMAARSARFEFGESGR